MGLGLKGLGIVERGSTGCQLNPWDARKEREKRTGRTEARLVVYFRTLGLHQGGQAHRSLHRHLVGTRARSDSPLNSRCVPAWVENVGNGVGPLHRKVDRNAEASRGPRVLKDLPSGRNEVPLQRPSMDSVVLPIIGD